MAELNCGWSKILVTECLVATSIVVFMMSCSPTKTSKLEEPKKLFDVSLKFSESAFVHSSYLCSEQQLQYDRV